MGLKTLLEDVAGYKVLENFEVKFLTYVQDCTQALFNHGTSYLAGLFAIVILLHI